MVIHHLICDGWTSNLIANKVAEYVKHYGFEDVVVEPLPSYVNFIQDECKYRQGRRFERDSTYWDEFATQFGETSFVKPKMPGSDDVRSERYTHHLSKEETKIMIKANPNQVDMLKVETPSLSAGLGLEAKIVVIPDDSIIEGGCIVTTTNGIVDATIDTQISIISEALKEV